MKTITFIALSFLTMLYRCGPDDSGNYENRIKIDSIAINRSVLINEPIIIKFYGKIGTRSNEFFNRIEIQQTNDTAKFAAIVRGDYKRNQYKESYLNGEERKIFAKQKGILRIIILQPENKNNYSDSVIVM